MHTYYLTVAVRAPDYFRYCVVDIPTPLTTRNGVAEALNAAAYLVEADVERLAIMHHIDLTPAPPTDVATLTGDQQMALVVLLRDAYGYLKINSAGQERMLRKLPDWLLNGAFGATRDAIVSEPR